MTLREETSVQPRPLQIFNVTALVFRYAFFAPSIAAFIGNEHDRSKHHYALLQ